MDSLGAGAGLSVEGPLGLGEGVWLSVSGQMVVVSSSITVTMVPAPTEEEWGAELGAGLGAGASLEGLGAGGWLEGLGAGA